MNADAFYPADILLPDQSKITDMSRWACVACDQYTSEPDYWQQAEAFVGDFPSALRLTLPEVYLSDPQIQRRISHIQNTMGEYLKQGLFKTYSHCFIYLERTLAGGAVRKGLIGMVDLEQYSYLPGSASLIRATEGTVLERIPPRVRIRQGAPLEMPHVMMLIDDPCRTVIEPIARKARQHALQKVYDFPLMMRSGSVKGFLVDGPELSAVQSGLAALIEPQAFASRYHLPEDTPPLLFAVGDGNHSLATAKACFEQLKKELPRSQWENHPARYALVEVVNLHDESLRFEPVHRFVEGTDPQALLAALKEQCGADGGPDTRTHVITAVTGGKTETLRLKNTTSNLPVGVLQRFLDRYLKEHSGQLDYIHGDDVALSLSQRPDAVSFLLPAMEKSQLFPTVLLDGVLPRKTFSMGHACDKRFYLEARRITL